LNQLVDGFANGLIDSDEEGFSGVLEIFKVSFSGFNAEEVEGQLLGADGFKLKPLAWGRGGDEGGVVTDGGVVQWPEGAGLVGSERGGEGWVGAGCGAGVLPMGRWGQLGRRR
jgi:hypothetical protein